MAGGETKAPSGPADAAFWSAIASQYDVDRTVVNLENAYWGVMAKPVEKAYIERIRFVNRTNVVYVRDAWPNAAFSEDLVHARIAGFGVRVRTARNHFYAQRDRGAAESDHQLQPSRRGRCGAVR
jgi:hypothetical protein